MKRMRLVLFSMALLVTLFGLTAIVAYAQVTTHTQAVQNSHVQVTCSGNGCNGLNPVTTGCSAGAYTVQTAVFSNSYVELRYSPTCGTNWGRVTSKVGEGSAFRFTINGRFLSTNGQPPSRADRPDANDETQYGSAHAAEPRPATSLWRS